MVAGLDELDSAGTLISAESVLLRRREAELDDLRLIAHWAALHAADPTIGPNGRRNWAGGDRLIPIGGDGTPWVQDLCLEELAISRQTHPLSTRSSMAAVLDLQFRLPRIWAVVEDLAVDAWVACKVATMSRHLNRYDVEVVDVAIAECIAGEAPSRVFEITAAKIIEANPDLHAAKVEAERRRRYVTLSQPDETGLRHVIARIEAGDALWVDAMVNRVADILAQRGDDSPRDMLRSKAFGWLARPAELLILLMEAATEADCQGEPEAAPDESPVSKALALPADQLAALRTINPDKLRSPAVLYVHLHEAAVRGEGSAVARCEGVGPLLPDQVKSFLGHAHVTTKPVIDLTETVSVNCYEHPEWLKERTLLRMPGDVFPYAVSISRNVEFDHPKPYKPHAPPGQTGDHNSGPMRTHHHRAKTHLGYRLRQIGPGEYVWRTPHGRYLVVSHLGTRPLTEADGHALMEDTGVVAD